MKRLIAICLAAGSFGAQAEFQSGASLLEIARRSEPEARGFIHGYIQGVHDLGRGAMHCSPADIRAGEVVRVVLVALVNTGPEQLNKSADTLISAILRSVWPCEKEGI